MDTLYPCCAGLDVYKATVVACVRTAAAGGKVRREVADACARVAARRRELDVAAAW
jgi:hypothetical protein